MMQQSKVANKQQKLKMNHDGALTIATAASRTASHWKNSETRWSEFLQRVSQTVRTQETIGEYNKLSKKEQGAIKDVGGFVGGSLKGGKRRADTVAWRQLLTLDADFIKGDFWDGVTMSFDNACAVYSTHKHTPEKPRLRLLIPLSRSVTAEEYVAISRKVAELLGIDAFDDTTYQPHRLMYWPSTSRDAEFVFEYQDEEWLDPDSILAMYEDWRDPLEWPTSSRQAENHKKMANKQGDPLAKPGMVGAFCRSYSISEAIETFLKDKYTSAGESRYTYVDGSTQGGLVVYDDLFAYSHHSTDPCSELLVNAFDIVRMHKFHHLDEDAKEGTPVNRLPSFKEMREFAKSDDRVKATLTSEKLKSVEEDFGDMMDDVSDLTEDESFKKWTKKLEYDGSGELEVNAKNIKLILENDPNLKGRFGFDDFRKQPTVLKKLPWRNVDRFNALWGNADDEDLRNYLDITWGIRSSANKIADVLGGVTRENTFHPVRDYLNELKWDGVSRVENLLIEYLGAEDNIYTKAVTRKTLVAAVARVFEPGCKFDYMLTLVGEQGLGKSMLFNRLGGDWFSDSLTSIHGKEAYEALHGVWIMEMAELAATRKSETEAIKQFLTKQVDRYRVAYGKRPEEFRRQCIFIGTTNEHDFLRDKTGNRRFWPVPVARERMKKNWTDLDKETVKQIWAEAVELYRKGELLILEGEEAVAAAEMQLSHTEESPYYGLIVDFVDKKVPEDWYQKTLVEKRLWLETGNSDFVDEVEKEDESELILRDKICAIEIWCELLGNDKRKFPMMERREINDILRRLPGWKPHESKSGSLRFGEAYGIQRAFVRE